MKSERKYIKLVKKEFAKRNKQFDKGKLEIVRIEDIFVDVCKISAICVKRTISKERAAGRKHNIEGGNINFKVPETFEPIPNVHLVKPNSLKTYQCNKSETCPSCKGLKVCKNCNGQGKLKCSLCNGSGYVGNDFCSRCNGKGIQLCTDCNATGGCSRCNGSGIIACRTCDGTGFLQEWEVYNDEYTVYRSYAWDNNFYKAFDYKLISSLDFKDEKPYKVLTSLNNGSMNKVLEPKFPDAVNDLLSHCENPIKIGEQEMKGKLHTIQYKIGNFWDILYCSGKYVCSQNLEPIKNPKDSVEKFESMTYENSPDAIAEKLANALVTFFKWLIYAGVAILIIIFLKRMF